MIKTKRKQKRKSLFSWILIFTSLLTSIPMYSYAATPVDISVDKFFFTKYIEVINGKPVDYVEVTIQGNNFKQSTGKDNSIETVISDISIDNGNNIYSLFSTDAKNAGVKPEIESSRIIRIKAPVEGEYSYLKLATEEGINTIIVDNKYFPNKPAKIKVSLADLPSMPGPLEDKNVYSGQSLTIKGSGFNNLKSVKLGETEHTNLIVNTAGTELVINPVGTGKYGLKQSILFLKEIPQVGVQGDINYNPPISYTVQYKDRINLYNRLNNMDLLKIQPTQGNIEDSERILVQSINPIDKTTVLKNIFIVNPTGTDTMKMYLRNPKTPDIMYELNNIELERDENGDVTGIYGFTPRGKLSWKNTTDKYYVVIEYDKNPGAQAVSVDTYQFNNATLSPKIDEIFTLNKDSKTVSSEKPEKFLVKGKRILTFPESFFIFPNGKISPINSSRKANDSNTLVIDYKIESPDGINPKYGNREVIGIQREIKVKAALDTIALDMPIATSETRDLESHFATGAGVDGVVFLTQPPNNSLRETVYLTVDTILTFSDGSDKLRIPGGTTSEPLHLEFIDKNPRPRIIKVEPEYGLFHDVNGIQKPLMLRLTGENFYVKWDDVNKKTIYPRVEILESSLKPLNKVSVSQEKDDIKVYKNGVLLNGEGDTLGDTMVIAIKPVGDGLVRELLDKQTHMLDSKIKIINIVEDGVEVEANPDDYGDFQFKHPSELNIKQPKIEGIYRDDKGTDPITEKDRLSTTKDTVVYVHVSSNSDLGNYRDIKLTVDGKLISTDGKIEGAKAVLKVTIPKGFVGMNRLQVILPDGLMDSVNLYFDDRTGPEIKEIIPNTGDSGSIVVIKRDTQSSTVGFQKSDQTKTNIDEKIGTKVILVDEDINITYDGYHKDDAGNLIFNTDHYFSDNVNGNTNLLLPSKYVYVVDSDTIYLKIPDGPDGLKPGSYRIKVRNSDGSQSPVGKVFTVVDSIAKTKIGTIDPSFDDDNGGIITTITAGSGTNFKGEVDVFFGSQKGTVVGYNLDYTKVYVKVPPLVDYSFPENPGDSNKIQTFTVPVTVANKVNKSTDTKSDGFIYKNPNYTVKINEVYKNGMSPTDPNANKVNAGDDIWINGENFRGTTKDGKTVQELPIVMFGYTKVQAYDYEIMNIGTEKAELSRIKVKVPAKPMNIASDGSVDILVQNYDGAKAIKAKGVIYGTGKPVIDEKTSTLSAKKTGSLIRVNAKDIFEDGLIVAFGQKKYEEALGNKSFDMVLFGKGEGEKIVVKYLPGESENIEIYYMDPSGKMELMKDATVFEGDKENITDGKISLGNDPGITKVVGINWQNPNYHKASGTPLSEETLKTINKEYIYIKTIQDGPSNYLEVRRGLGKVEPGSFKIDKLNNSTMFIQTPYYDDPNPNTEIYLINSDGSEASADFKFVSGIDPPAINDLEGSKERTVTLDGAQKKVKIKTQDYTVDGTVKIIGKNLKDIESVKFGTKDIKVESISPNYDYIIVSVPKAKADEVGKPIEVTITTKEGNAFSSRTVPPVYFMYIAADSKPIIETVTPAVGPRTGGTLVTITGKGFREKDEFGVVSDKVEERITITVNGSMPAGLKSTTKNEQGEIVELKVIMPPSVTGPAKLQVINADGGTSEPKDFNYISQPKISKTEGSIFFNDTESVVKLFGEDFQSGAKVIIGAEQTKGKKPADSKISGMVEVASDGQNQQAHLTGGVEAADVKVTGSNQITFKMPSGIESLENTSIIIVNPDTGMSGPGTGNIKPPVPDVPRIEATPGFERSIILRWTVDKDVLNAAEKFEIYVKERSANDYTFVGDTKQDTTTQTYVIKGLKYNTTYDVKVRVMNKYGEATDLGTARTTTLSQSDDYKEKEKQEAVDKAVDKIVTEGKQEIIGDTLYYTVGTNENNIDISKTTAKNKTKYVQVPVKDIKSGSKTIIITDKDMTFTVNYSSLNVTELRNAPDDAVFRFKISAADKKIEESLNSAIPRNLKRASNVYGIYFELAQPKLVTPIASLSGSATFNINAPAYPKYHAVYIESADTFSILQSNSITQGGYYVLLTNKQ